MSCIHGTTSRRTPLMLPPQVVTTASRVTFAAATCSCNHFGMAQSDACQEELHVLRSCAHLSETVLTVTGLRLPSIMHQPRIHERCQMSL